MQNNRNVVWSRKYLNKKQRRPFGRRLVFKFSLVRSLALGCDQQPAQNDEDDSTKTSPAYFCFRKCLRKPFVQEWGEQVSQCDRCVHDAHREHWIRRAGHHLPIEGVDDEPERCSENCDEHNRPDRTSEVLGGCSDQTSSVASCQHIHAYGGTERPPTDSHFGLDSAFGKEGDEDREQRHAGGQQEAFVDPGEGIEEFFHDGKMVELKCTTWS